MSIPPAIQSLKVRLGKGWAGFLRKLPVTRRGRILLLSATLVSIAAFVVVVLLTAINMSPGYWNHNQKLLASDNATLLQLANTFEQRALHDLSGSPQSPVKTLQVHVAFDEINAWLSIKLEDYLANRQIDLPPEISQPMLAGKEGRLVLAFLYKSTNFQQVISIELSPVFEPSGNRFQLKLVRARAGILPLPVETIRNQASGQSPEMKVQMDQIFDVLGNQWLEAVQNHPGDARKNLRLTGVQITEQGLDLTLRTEPRTPSSSQP